MPRIQIRDGYNGRAYMIESSDKGLVATWLWETLNRLESTAYHPGSITIEPLWGPDGLPDWSPNASERFNAELGGVRPVDNVRGLIAALSQYADFTEGQS